MTNYHPLFVGFDSLFNELDRSVKAPSYPPYNLYKHDTDKYVIVMALAGWNEEEVKVSLQKSKLVVEGKALERLFNTSDEIYHRGISKRDFKQAFTLAENLLVDHVEFVNGLLKVHLLEAIPEENKPKYFDFVKKQFLTE